MENVIAIYPYLYGRPLQTPLVSLIYPYLYQRGHNHQHKSTTMNPPPSKSNGLLLKGGGQLGT